ncbi:hypothetical protein DFJ73DRAFT_768013 [Zopfochytrium polystomum]|nr:hypothetical protein DFJ73DRAFT_768013 [Zopfochytrium polystomum]
MSSTPTTTPGSSVPGNASSSSTHSPAAASLASQHPQHLDLHQLSGSSLTTSSPSITNQQGLQGATQQQQPGGALKIAVNRTKSFLDASTSDGTSHHWHSNSASLSPRKSGASTGDTHLTISNQNTIVTDLHVAGKAYNGSNSSNAVSSRRDAFKSMPWTASAERSASLEDLGAEAAEDDEKGMNVHGAVHTNHGAQGSLEFREQHGQRRAASPGPPEILSLPATHIVEFGKLSAFAALNVSDDIQRLVTADSCETAYPSLAVAPNQTAILINSFGLISLGAARAAEPTWMSDSRLISVGKKISVAALLPFELLLQILSHFDPHPTDALFLLSKASTTAPLHACALVNRWWNRAAVTVLWRRPWLHDTAQFEKLVKVAERDGSAGGLGQSATADMKISYPSLLKDLTLSATLPEPDRYSGKLSPLLTRLLMLPDFHLSTLDLGFCKGVTNFALQRCAHALSRLTALNLAGGGRSEICVIKVARECGPSLKRLGLGWNPAVGDFCVKEVVRLCPGLEWLDLSGCHRVGDFSCLAIVRRPTDANPTNIAVTPTGWKLCCAKFGGGRHCLTVAIFVIWLATSSPTPTCSVFSHPTPVRFNRRSSFAAGGNTHTDELPTANPTHGSYSLRTDSNLCSIKFPTTGPTSTRVRIRYLCLNYCLGVTDHGIRELLEHGGAATSPPGSATIVGRLEVLNAIGCGEVRGVGWWAGPSVVARGGASRVHIDPTIGQPRGTLAVATGTPPGTMPLTAAAGSGPAPTIRGVVWVGPKGIGVPEQVASSIDSAGLVRPVLVNVPDFVPFWGLKQ